jgi:hypothetical protein
LTPFFSQSSTLKKNYPFWPTRLLGFSAIVGAMTALTWPQIVAVCLVCWVAVALVVGTIVGHGIAVGTASDCE